MGNRDAVFEILTENLPVRYILPAEEQLKDLARSYLGQAGLSFEDVEAFATCRRLVLYIRRISVRSGGRRAGGAAAAALGPVFARAVSGLKFAETMLWGEGSVPFARPIRGLLALYGGETVVFRAAGLTSGRASDALRPGESGPINIRSAGTYFKTLERAGILVKDGERLAFLRRAVADCARLAGFTAEPDEAALRENLYLAERPTCFAGNFSAHFLKLPPELLRLVLGKQLKLFSLRGPGNRLEPYFLAVTDGVIKGRRELLDGFRGTVEARLRDAAFIHSRDLSLDPATGAVTFAAKLGASIRPLDRDVRRKLENLKKLGF